MAAHNTLGKSGEQAAVDYLEKHGYTIRHRNWRKGHLELDIVAAKDNLLVVAEVKTRSTTDYPQPEEAVDFRKRNRIVRAANAYINFFNPKGEVRFDIITVVGKPEDFRIEHIENAFYPY